MDALHARYSRPMELMSVYIRQRRFGDFTAHVIREEQARRQEERAKEEEWRMWTAYLHSHTDKSYEGWRAELLRAAARGRGKPSRDEALGTEDVRALVARLFPDGKRGETD